MPFLLRFLSPIDAVDWLSNLAQRSRDAGATKGRLLLLLCLPLLTLACEKEPLDTLDELVPATQEGANTLGCLIDGEVFYNRGGSSNDLDITATVGNSPLYTIEVVGKEFLNDRKRVFLKILNPRVGPIQPITSRPILGFNIGIGADTDDYFLNLDFPYDVNVNHLDELNNIISRTFNFVVTNQTDGSSIAISDGRFDVKYQ